MRKKKISDLPILKRLALKLVHKAQKFTLKKGMMGLYFKLAKLHFRICFGKNLVNEIAFGTEEADAAARRYARMLINNIGKEKFSPSRLKQRYQMFQQNFKKTLVLEYRLEREDD